MSVLLDTNVLLRLSQRDHPHRQIAERAISLLREGDQQINLVAQNIVEFWVVATRPLSSNGLGRTIEQAASNIGEWKFLFPLLPEVPLQSEWEQLVKTYRISGKNSHDARLVAAMMVHGVSSILTFDADFVRYPFLTVLDPHAIA